MKHLVIIDMYSDEYLIKKEYPNPMVFIKEDDMHLFVDNHGFVEKIEKEKIKKIHHIY